MASFGLVPCSFAQKKVYRSGAVWPELQAEYVFKTTSFFYFRNHYRHNLDNDFNQIREQGPLKHLERIQFRAGYEHIFGEHWSGGIAESYAVEPTRKIIFNEVFGRHLGNLGSFRLSERLSFEHIIRLHQNKLGRVRFRADLDHDLKIGKIITKPRISYDMFFNIDYELQENAVSDRNMDRSRLRFDVLLPINNFITITPYFTRQTDFFEVEPAYDEKQVLVRLGGKQNHITPIYGLELRYVFFEGRTPFSRTIPSKIGRAHV